MWSAQDIKYEPVDTEGSSLNTAALRSERKRISLYRIGALAALLTILLALASAIYATIAQSHATATQEKPPRFPCGRTPGQAKAANCTFDVMMDEWLPESCIDRDLLDEFKALGPWSFWADEGRTQPIDEERLSRSAVAYTTLEYHVAHCSFAVRKFHRAVAAGRPVEEAVGKVAHTTHCAEMHRKVVESLQRAKDGEAEQYSIFEATTPLHPGFPTCRDVHSIEMFS